MESNGFMIGPEIKKLFKIKVGTLIAKHPVDQFNFDLAMRSLVSISNTPKGPSKLLIENK